MLRIEEGSHLDVDSPYFAVLEQSSNGMGSRSKAMGMNSDLSTPPEYVVNHSGRALLGSLPLIRGEDGCASNELCARIAAAVKPKDFIEEIWVRDVADLQGVCGEAQAKKLSLQWETGAIGQIDQLAATGRTVESITADAFLATSKNLGASIE
jgi:hypothetical protein